MDNLDKQEYASGISWHSVSPCHLSNESIVKLTQSVSSQCAYEPGQDLRGMVVKKLSGSVETASFDEIDESQGFFGDEIRIKDIRNFRIRVSPFAGELRERFSIAHEIGHYVLHFLYPRQIERKTLTNVRAFRAGGELAEQEANWFAANFLMPADAFRSSYAEHSGQIIQIAADFKVSQRTAFYRSKGLKLIPA